MSGFGGESLGNISKESLLAKLFGSAAQSKTGDPDMSPVSRDESFMMDVEAGERWLKGGVDDIAEY